MKIPSGERTAKFWSLVNINPNGCWEWNAYLNKWGYGTFYYEGDVFLAHRVSWVICNSRSPGQLCVLHKCDNPKCVRPDHLFLGTDLDNARDKIKKGRARIGVMPRGDLHWSRRIPEKIPKGERNGHAKLSSEDVKFIRENYVKRKVPYTFFAKKFGVEWSTIRSVVKMRNWKHYNPLPF